ncbi:MFS transporter [Hymenobacter sp. GOD-10R]|uniref:MFS transporter n=1 Tax=Hymenobacter sp. GOD-10R TaxID=3093922 RepID=UPI002D786840|nr:MFS transporter [Hymenobacter sp. GOD-10R]WRQ29517.1 MFS transporter [Hymenobacter sp. GOD-10R]
MTSDTFRAFRSRNYRLFFAGQSLSLLGTWMQKTAVSWVIYSLTHSKFMLGVSVFATLFPAAMFSFLGGGVADRYQRYRVLLLTQVLSMVQALLLTLLVFFRPNGVWGIVALSVVLGIINAFDVPVRQSLVPELVDDKQDLPNALALNSAMVTLAQLLGPAFAGFALEKLGAVACFGLNAVSFVAVIGSLLSLKLPAYVPKPRTKSMLEELQEGLHYVAATPAVRHIIVMLMLISLFVLPFTTLLPVYAKDIFHGNATTFGMLEGAVGLGAFIGAFFLASRQPGTNLKKLLAVNTFILGVGLLVYSHMSWYVLALLSLVFGAFGMVTQLTISNTLLQTTVPLALRGRVLSLYVLAYAGLLPLGSLLVGAVSQRIGVQNTVLAEGIMAVLIGLLHVLALRREKLAQQASPLPIQATPEVAL